MSSASRIVVIGEALLDVLHDDGRVVERPGGSPANVAVALARLGIPVQLVTTLGADRAGAAVRGWLASAGVDVLVDPDAGGTSVAHGTVDADGAASYTFDLRWQLGAEAVRPVLDDPPAWVHVGSLGAVVDPGAETVHRLVSALPAATLVSYDPNVRPGLVDLDAARTRVEALVALAAVVKASDDDLRALYPYDAPPDVARRWVRGGTALVVRTHGSGGATATTAQHEVRVPAVPAAVVDTVGAGDAFMGMLLARLHRSGTRDALAAAEVADVLRDCVAAAAASCARRGAYAPDRAEVDRWRRH